MSARYVAVQGRYIGEELGAEDFFLPCVIDTEKDRVCGFLFDSSAELFASAAPGEDEEWVEGFSWFPVSDFEIKE